MYRIVLRAPHEGLKTSPKALNHDEPLLSRGRLTG